MDGCVRSAAAGIIVVAATQRPSADIIPTSLRDLFGYRWAFRCTTDASSDVILGHGWANQGYSAAEIDPTARGVAWLIAEGGIPRRMKAAYLSDGQAARILRTRALHHRRPRLRLRLQQPRAVAAQDVQHHAERRVERLAEIARALQRAVDRVEALEEPDVPAVRTR